jgi:tetratricopeptide (TPR) repeat protein
VEQAELTRRGGQQTAWLNRLEWEHDNVRAALQWSIQKGGDGVIGARLAGALWWFWEVRGHWHEGRHWLETFLAHPQYSAASASIRTKVLTGAGALAAYQGDSARATLLLEQSLVLCRELGDLPGCARALSNLGVLADKRGDYAHATALYEQSLALYRDLHDPWGTASVLSNLGVMARFRGDMVQAIASFEQSLALYRELHHTVGCAWMLSNLGIVLAEQGDHRRATAFIKESLVLYQELDDRVGIAECLVGIAGMIRAPGYAQCAAQLLGAAEALFAAVGVQMDHDEHAAYRRTIATIRAALDEATFTAAVAEGRALPLEQVIGCAVGACA